MLKNAGLFHIPFSLHENVIKSTYWCVIPQPTSKVLKVGCGNTHHTNFRC